MPCRLVFVLDGDGEDNPADVPRLLMRSARRKETSGTRDTTSTGTRCAFESGSFCCCLENKGLGLDIHLQFDAASDVGPHRLGADGQDFAGARETGGMLRVLIPSWMRHCSWKNRHLQLPIRLFWRNKARSDGFLQSRCKFVLMGYWFPHARFLKSSCEFFCFCAPPAAVARMHDGREFFVEGEADV